MMVQMVQMVQMIHLVQMVQMVQMIQMLHLVQMVQKIQLVHYYITVFNLPPFQGQEVRLTYQGPLLIIWPLHCSTIHKRAKTPIKKNFKIIGSKFDTNKKPKFLGGGC